MKEPWQMTRAEFENSGVETEVTEMKATWDALSPAKKQMAPSLNPYGSEGYIRLNRQDTNLRYHKAQVTQALSEGKPVPSSVLADYPELGKFL